jgi:hypothetical protein
MTLTVLQRAELEALGPATVRFKLLQGSSDRRAPISGFKYGNIMLADIEDWLVEKNVEEIALQQGTLRWAKIAGWAAVVGIIVTVIFGAVAVTTNYSGCASARSRKRKLRRQNSRPSEAGSTSKHH